MTDDRAESVGPALADLETDRWRRLDPRMLLVHLVQEPIRFLPVLVGVLFLGRSTNGGDEAWRYLAIPAVLAVGLLRYLTTRYRIGNGQIELRKGLLNKQILATPADRVRTVDVTSPPIHRLLGLAKVELGTAGAGNDRIVLDALRVADARRLREELIHLRSVTPPGADEAPVDAPPGEPPQETTLLRLDPRWVRYAPVTMTGVVSALALFGFANQYLTRLLERGVVEDAVDRIGDYPWWVDSLVGFVAVAMLVTVLAVIGYVLQFWGFRLTRHPGGTLHVTRGLFTSRESSIEEKRIRGLEVGEPLGLRLVGGGRLQVVTTGVSRHEDRRGTTWLVPPAPRAVVEGVAAAVLHDEEALSGPLTPHGPSARRRRWVRALVPSLVVLLVVLVGDVRLPLAGRPRGGGVHAAARRAPAGAGPVCRARPPADAGPPRGPVRLPCPAPRHPPAHGDHRLDRLLDVVPAPGGAGPPRRDDRSREAALHGLRHPGGGGGRPRSRGRPRPAGPVHRPLTTR